MTVPNPCPLHVYLYGAEKLSKKDLFGICDPYVQITLGSRQQQDLVHRSKAVRKSLNPIWKEKFEFPSVNPRDQYIIFEVFDEHRVSKDNCIGGIKVKLADHKIQCKKCNIVTEVSQMITAPLHKRNGGSKSKLQGFLQFKLLYYCNPVSTQPRQLDLGSLVVGANTRDNNSPSLRQTSSSTSLTSGSSMSTRPSNSRRESNTEGAVSVQRRVSDSTALSSSPSSRQSQLPRQNSQSNNGQNEWVLLEEPAPLPPGWEERQDAQGRMFYIDHINRRTQWQRPEHSAASDTEVVQRQHEMEHRHFTMRRHFGERTMSVVDLQVQNGTTAALTLSNSLSASQESPTANRERRASQREEAARPQLESPSPVSVEEDLPPGWEKRTAENGRVFFIDHNTKKTQWDHPTKNTKSTKKTASIKLPKSQEEIEKQLGPLPPGWEKRTNESGKNFFIDHNTRSTQWEDPRIVKLKNAQIAAVPYSRDYKRKYEHFKLNLPKPPEQPKQFEIPVRRDHIFEDSHRALMSVKNKDLFHCRMWVKFDKEKGLDYGGVAREWFFLLSHDMFNPYFGLFEYNQRAKDSQKIKIKKKKKTKTPRITDEGWNSQKRMSDPVEKKMKKGKEGRKTPVSSSKALFSDNYILQINPDSGRCNEDHLNYFKFIGRVCGLAVYHKKLIDAFFVRPFYKVLLNKKIVLQDIEACDVEFYNSTKYILENDPEPLCLNFSVTREWLGQVTEIDLKPGGQDIEVTNRNKKEYVELMLKYQFETRFKEQMEAFKRGFNDVIPLQMLKIFDEREVEYLLCGLSEINVEDWRKNTVYVGYKETDDIILWFWKAVENFDIEMRARLLQFATGTSRVPMNGFSELHGSNGPQRFCLKKLGEPGSLPRSHTCFNRIDLPPYNSYHDLKEKLRLAVENCEGFEGVD